MLARESGARVDSSAMTRFSKRSVRETELLDMGCVYLLERVYLTGLLDSE